MSGNVAVTQQICCCGLSSPARHTPQRQAKLFLPLTLHCRALDQALPEGFVQAAVTTQLSAMA